MARRVWVLENRQISAAYEGLGESEGAPIELAPNNPKARARYLKECLANKAPWDRFRLVAYYPKEAK